MSLERAQARSRLDARTEGFRATAGGARPHKGWIRAVRDALGMTTSEMASRMGIIQQNITALERSEVRDTIKLDTLRRAAAALECDLVYALVPRTSLNATVRAQAASKAATLLGPVAHHSRLENQALSRDEMDAQLEELVDQLVDRRGLWSEA